MTPHNHSTFVKGCYRCELGRDEAEFAERESQVERHCDAAAMYVHGGQFGRAESELRMALDLIGQLEYAR